MPNVYVIAGPNGAGKTTSAKALVPKILDSGPYLNADFIAHDLCPTDPDSVAIKAGRIMLNRMDSIVAMGSDFAFESTLASRIFIRRLQHLKSIDYTITILYLSLSDPDLAVYRVKTRVLAGGHDIPEATIRRRFERSKHNFVSYYSKLADNWFFYDNCGIKSVLVARHIQETEHAELG